MASPSLFQEAAMEVNNPQSREEDEEIEEQKRRQEELTDLLAAGIHAFNYDESTINSTSTSFEGTEQNDDEIKNGKPSLITISPNLSQIIEQDYKETTPQDQLKVLYEVRVREIKKLADEFSKYQAEKAKEISILKNKVTLAEAEMRHLQLSLTNSESLLVEKTEIIKNLQQNMVAKDQEIENLRKSIDDLKLEVCTYSSTINELHLKQSDNNPFNVGARKFNSEELQKAHQDQIIKLQTLLQEQIKMTQILEKENARLKDDISKFIKNKNESDEENNLTILQLSKKLQNSQQQCRDLFLLGEAIKKESDHFKERMQQLEINNLDVSSDGIKMKKMDKETMMVHMEKLKRMLLDKDVEMNTLKAKLKFYNSDLDELFEYRKLLNEMYTCEIKPCSNIEHEEMLIFLQRQLQSYQQAVEDRNNQIMNLNMVNKELQEKIEEMIQQTRTDIQNLSQKYSLPQLETMSNELKNAERTIIELKKQLSEKRDGSPQELIKELEKVQKENERLQQIALNEGDNFQKALETLKTELKREQELTNGLKKSESQLMEENAKIKSELEKICSKLGVTEADVLESDELNSLKSKYGKVYEQLHQVATYLEKMSPKRAVYYENNKIVFQLKKHISYYLDSLRNQDLDKSEMKENLKRWENMLKIFIENLDNINDQMEAGAKESELRDSVEDLTNAKTMLEGEKFALEYQLKSATEELEEAKKEIKILGESRDTLMKKCEDNARTIQKLNDRLNELNVNLQMVEANKIQLEQELEEANKRLNEAKEETIELQKEVSEANENVVRRNLFKELKDVENVLEQGRTDNNIVGTDIFQKYLQAEILKAELSLRQCLEEENVKKMQKIEDQYKNALIQKCDFHNKERDKWKKQEGMYRKQLAEVLEECGRKMKELEEDNITLVKQASELVKEYKIYRSNTETSIENYKKIIANAKKNFELLDKKWENLVEYFMENFMKIQKQNQKKSKTILKKISMTQTELDLIESMYAEKIKNIKLRGKYE